MRTVMCGARSCTAECQGILGVMCATLTSCYVGVLQQSFALPDIGLPGGYGGNWPGEASASVESVSNI